MRCHENDVCPYPAGGFDDRLARFAADEGERVASNARRFGSLVALLKNSLCSRILCCVELTYCLSVGDRAEAEIHRRVVMLGADEGDIFHFATSTWQTCDPMGPSVRRDADQPCVWRQP